MTSPRESEPKRYTPAQLRIATTRAFRVTCKITRKVVSNLMLSVSDGGSGGALGSFNFKFDEASLKNTTNTAAAQAGEHRIESA